MFKLYSSALVAAAVFSAQTAFAQAPPSVTTTDIRGSGNTVIVSGSGQGSVRVLTNDQGQGNRVIVTHNGKVVLPQKVSYQGKDNRFWSQKVFDADLRMTLFHCPKTQLWFRYHADKDAYLPAVEFYQRQARQAEREVRRTLDEVDRLLERLDRELP